MFRSISIEREMGKTVDDQKVKGKTEKVLKIVFETQNTCFSQLDQVASQLPGKPRNTKLEKFL